MNEDQMNRQLLRMILSFIPFAVMMIGTTIIVLTNKDEIILQVIDYATANVFRLWFFLMLFYGLPLTYICTEISLYKKSKNI